MDEWQTFVADQVRQHDRGRPGPMLICIVTGWRLRGRELSCLVGVVGSPGERVLTARPLAWHDALGAIVAETRGVVAGMKTAPAQKVGEHKPKSRRP